MIGKETKFLVGDTDPNLNHEDLSIPGKCDSNLECDLNAYSADNVLKPGTNSNIGVSYASKRKSGFVDDEGIEIVYDKTAKFMEAGVQPNSEGASTPGSISFNG
ncbi:hypothetical protein L1987_06873 [Smallanthus sonchifolius]|uniref:Uncharacterized protein n=1 Tax=Smallanthus sonchifolius TaxID=185202 RepID=A0ACB9JZB3_9ASTR|nr:hypothetical protein L1987_06873 [Smallanthus sonchifolius]